VNLISASLQDTSLAQETTLQKSCFFIQKSIEIIIYICYYIIRKKVIYMKELQERLEKIVMNMEDVQYPEEYLLYELREIFKEEETVQVIKKELLETL